MIGLKTNESEKFKKYFSAVQEHASSLDSVFFLDAGDGREFETDIMEGEDLMGWLIPNGIALIFESLWVTNDIDDSWSDYYAWAIWEFSANELVNITFKK